MAASFLRYLNKLYFCSGLELLLETLWNVWGFDFWKPSLTTIDSSSFAPSVCNYWTIHQNLIFLILNWKCRFSKKCCIPLSSDWQFHKTFHEYKPKRLFDWEKTWFWFDLSFLEWLSKWKRWVLGTLE